MAEDLKTARKYIAIKRLEQVRRQHRDRKQQFADYVERKRREEMAREESRPLFSGPTAEFVVVIDDAQTDEPPRKKLFSEIPSIEGERVVLDRVIESDADALHDLIDNPLVQRYLPTYLFEKQRDDVHETISLLYGDLYENKESLILAIRIKETGELAGLAEFYGLRDSLHKISVGSRLRECWWGRGIATETVHLMVDYLYGETDIEIITASTMVQNKGSAHVLDKAGFIRTARNAEEDWGFPEPTIVDKWFY